MKTTSRVIQIVVRKGIPKNSVAAIARELGRVGSVRVRQESPGPHGAGEWALPALLIVFVAKPLFEGFLNELGADGARTLKAKLAKFVRRLKTRENRWVTRSDIQHYEKQVKAGHSPPLPGRVGPIFSIEFELEHTSRIRYSIRCVLPHGLTDDQVTAALKQLPHDVRAAAKQERPSSPKNGYLRRSDTYVYVIDAQRWQKARYLPPARITDSKFNESP
jgi:hypothetical protein